MTASALQPTGSSGGSLRRNHMRTLRQRTGRRPTVAVIGAGASGTLTARHLLDRGAVVWLVDPAAETGRGVAYRTQDRRHRLNVCAGRMNALPDDPGQLSALGEATACTSGSV